MNALLLRGVLAMHVYASPLTGSIVERSVENPPSAISRAGTKWPQQRYEYSFFSRAGQKAETMRSRGKGSLYSLFDSCHRRTIRELWVPMIRADAVYAECT